MHVHHHLNSFKKLDAAVATIGTFDGVHIGHQKIIKTLCAEAKAQNVSSVVITFWPHPKQILQPNSQVVKTLFSVQERIDLLSNYEIDYLIVIPFDLEFSKMNSDDFIKNILIQTIGVGTLILGYDHRFGNNRTGSFEYLKNNASTFGLQLIEISRQDIDDIAVSSSSIRQAIADADFEKAKRLLGHPYFITGDVVTGRQLGNKIGFPTANIAFGDDKILPAVGVYATLVNIGEQDYEGMMNLGYRPTVNGQNLAMEVHILQFEKDIYNHQITVTPIQKLRDEHKFENLEALVAQLRIDKKNTEEIFKKKYSL